MKKALPIICLFILVISAIASLLGGLFPALGILKTIATALLYTIAIVYAFSYVHGGAKRATWVVVTYWVAVAIAIISVVLPIL